MPKRRHLTDLLIKMDGIMVYEARMISHSGTADYMTGTGKSDVMQEQ